MDKREFERRHLNARCVIRYLALDGRSVEQVVGTTGNISRGGVGILTTLSLRRSTPVHLSITSREGKTTSFTGVVAHSLPHVQGEYILGVQFSRIRDERLSKMLDPARAEEAATGSDELGPVGAKESAAHVEAEKPR